MTSESRSKQNVRGKSQVRRAKGGRRAPVKSSTGTPILAIVVGAILALVFIGLLIYGAINSRTNPIPTVAGPRGGDPPDPPRHPPGHQPPPPQSAPPRGGDPPPRGRGQPRGRSPP